MACLTLMADVEEYDMKKSYLLVLLVSVLLYLCLTPVKLCGSVWVCSWSSSWSYALLSWLVCDKVNPKGTGENVVLAMLLTLGYFIVDIPVRIIDFEGTWRTRQTLWGAMQMLTQNCCQTIHEEWYVHDSFYLCAEAFDF